MKPVNETGEHLGLLRNEKALILSTAGGTEEDSREAGATEVLEKLESDLMLKFCGIKNVKHVVFYNVIMTDQNTRLDYLETARNLGKGFF